MEENTGIEKSEKPEETQEAIFHPKHPHYQHPQEAIAFHIHFCNLALESLKKLIYLDRTSKMIEEMVVTKDGPSIANPRGDLTPTVAFDLPKAESLRQVLELGCHSAFFVPKEHLGEYKAGGGLPKVIPNTWVPIGKNINEGRKEGEYYATSPINALSFEGKEGLLIMRPNTPNEVLRDRYEVLLKFADRFSIETAWKMFNFKESDVKELPDVTQPVLSPEQLKCVQFASNHIATFIWGPPGAGKSVTLKGVVNHMLEQDKRVLIMATTNDAIDSMAEKIYDSFLGKKDPLIAEAVGDGLVTRYGVSHRSKKFQDMVYAYKVKKSRANGEVPPTSLNSMFEDTIAFSTFYRFFHMSPVSFDTILIDEVGAVNLPLLYCAACSAAKNIVVCGDPRQTTPIFTYNSSKDRLTNEVKKLWSTDIFTHNQFRLNPGDAPDERVVMLTTQYRMSDELAGFVRLTGLYPKYESPKIPRKLHPSEIVALNCHPLPNVPAVIIDTSSAPSPRNSENHNFVHFEITKLLAAHYIALSGIGSIGIVVPYKNQSTLYNKWVTGAKVPKIVAGTVHRFQGSEAPLIIFDTVESPPAGNEKCSHAFTDDIKYPDLNTINILNVAVSRVKAKMLFLMNVDYIKQNLTQGCYLHRILDECSRLNAIVPYELALRSIGKSFGETANVSAYFEKQPFQVQSADFNKFLVRDIKSARQTIEFFSKEFDRSYFYRILELLEPVCKQHGIYADFYLPGRMTKDDKKFIREQIAAKPYFTARSCKEWQYGDYPFIVFDGKLMYEPADGSIPNYLKGEIPGVTARFIYIPQQI